MAMENNYMTVAYRLYVKDEDDKEEELVEECTAEHPFMFISNLGQTLPAFEDVVGKLSEGEEFDFVIPCKDAYGEFNDELMFDVEKKIFEVDGVFDSQHIFEGNVVPLQGEDGSRFHGTVIEVKDDAVTLDLNHPRAGEDLHFLGKVCVCRAATNEEVAQQLRMMSGEGCGGCGGSCDGCEGCGTV